MAVTPNSPACPICDPDGGACGCGNRKPGEGPPGDIGEPSDPVEFAYDELCKAAIAVTGIVPRTARNGRRVTRLADAVAALGMRMAAERNALLKRGAR
jgi:hypothetical protein